MELNVVNGWSQVPVAPATAQAVRMLLGASGRCAALLGRRRACGARMRVVVGATWQAVSVVSRARSCAASVPLQPPDRPLVNPPLGLGVAAMGFGVGFSPSVGCDVGLSWLGLSPSYPRRGGAQLQLLPQNRIGEGLTVT